MINRIERLRERLTAVYESLSPLGQALVQLISIIYEPTDRKAIFKSLQRSGLSFPGEKVEKVEDLTPYLSRLQDLRLLDRNYRVHDAFVELATRKAVQEGRVHGLGEDLKGIDSLPSWQTAGEWGEEPCFVCEQPISVAALRGPHGMLCASCVENELRLISRNENIAWWPFPRLRNALSPDGDIRSRLTVLRDTQGLFSVRERSEKDDLIRLLVRNLGYVEPHPLAGTVRQAAFDACVSMGVQILPALIEMCEPDPWQYFVNVVMVARNIAPLDKRTQSLLAKAATHPNPEVRVRLVDAISGVPADWAFKILEILAQDRETDVRRKARAAAARPKLRGAAFRGQHQYVRESYSVLPGYYGPMVKAVEDGILTTQYPYSFANAKCPRLMRNLRIALYTGNRQLLDQCRQLMASRCSEMYADMDPMTKVVGNPFDCRWLRSLPFGIQAQALSAMFARALDCSGPDDEALACVLDSDYAKEAFEARHAAALHDLIERLAVGGRLTEVHKLLDPYYEIGVPAGHRGWVHFLEGRTEEALESFETDLRVFQRKVGGKKGYYFGLPGLFHLLALIATYRNNPSGLNRVKLLTEAHRSSPAGAGVLSVPYQSLLAIAHVLDSEPEEARRILERQKESPRVDGLSVFFSAYAAHWLDGRLSERKIDELSDIFIRSREIGLKWLAMECAELLCRVEDATPIRRNFVEQVQRETGMKSLVASIEIEEPWRRGLRALRLAASPERSPAPQSSDMRLAWFLRYGGGSFSLQAREQKRAAKGGWTRGRAVSLQRLFNGADLDYLTPQDHRIRGAVEREHLSRYYGDTYSLNIEKALPALVGHPLVFLEDAPSVSVEIVKGEPEVTVTRSGPELNIRFFPSGTDKGVALIQDTPTRFKVIELTEQHLRLARIVGGEGLNVPQDARDEVLSTIVDLSSLVTVHSAIGGAARDIVEVEADPTPHVHLMPSGSGFRAEMFVRPFADGGPYLKPGAGAENLIAEINEKRMQTRRDLTIEEKMAAGVESTCTTLAGLTEVDRQWYIEHPEDCLQLLLDLKALQEKGEVVVEWPEGEKLRITHRAAFDQLRMKIRGKTDWFEVSGQLELDDNLILDMKRLLEHVRASGSRFIPLGEGRFVELTRELRRKLEELDAYSESRGKDIRLHPLAALAIEDFTNNVPHLDADDAWKSRLARIHSAQDHTPDEPSTLKARLRDYQVEGYRWLSRLAHMGVGGCLADDMGLGKTLQALALLLERAPEGPALVVAPTSVCMNWHTEATRFAPTLNVMIFGGNNRENLIRELKGHDVLVCSYGLLVQEAELLSSIHWRTIVLDEAQAIKNVTTKRAQAAMNLNGDFKLITTGTPIENHLSELWTLFNFINPGLLGSQRRFNERFAIPVERYGNREARKRLKRLIQPFTLRRVKSQVLEELPPRTEVVLQVEMSREEAAFYEALRRHALERLEGDDSPLMQKHIKILAEIMKLRQAACNPRLALPESRVSSSKLELFGEVVSELLESRHKALVFSQFVGHLALIREYLDARKIDYRYLDGSTPPRERKREVDAFQAGKGDLFLISLKAGGLGLNLTAADYVIHMDPWWNPAAEDQASDRAHRIGQQRPVTVYRLVTRHTIEEKIVKLHEEKRDLAGSLLEGSDMSGKISAEELLNLIREQ